MEAGLISWECFSVDMMTVRLMGVELVLETII